MCNNCGTSRADLMIVCCEILKRFKQICDFSICVWQACYWFLLFHLCYPRHLLVLHHQLGELLKIHSRLQCTLSLELTLQTVTWHLVWTNLHSYLWTIGGRLRQQGSQLSTLLLQYHHKHQVIWHNQHTLCPEGLQLLYQQMRWEFYSCMLYFDIK